MEDSNNPSSIPPHILERIERIHLRNAAKKAAKATGGFVESKPETTPSPDRFLLNQEPSPAVETTRTHTPTKEVVRSFQEQPEGEELIDDPKNPGTWITKGELLLRDGPGN